MTLFYISMADFDYYQDSILGIQTGTLLLYVRQFQQVSPTKYTEAFGLIDTSAIPDTDIISAATFYFNANSYTATRGVTKNYYVQIWNGVGSFINCTNPTYINWSSGVNSFSLQSSVLQYINKTGYTIFRIRVPTPAATQFRQMEVNAYETSQATAMRLDVTYAPASTSMPQVIMIN